MAHADYHYTRCHIHFIAEFDEDCDLDNIIAVAFDRSERNSHGHYPRPSIDDYDLCELIGALEYERAQDPKVLAEMREKARIQWAENKEEAA